MKVLLLRPPRIKQAITLSDFMFSEPLGLEMIYGCIESVHTVEVFDMMCDDQTLESKLCEFEPDLIAITSLCIDVEMVLQLCEEIKLIDESMITVVGGTQAYLNPRAFISEFVDYIFKFTTRENIVQFYLQDMNGDIDGVLSKVNGYKGEDVVGRNEYILPDRKSTEKYRAYYSYFGYKPAAIMQISQGCGKACRFCLRWRLEGFEEYDFELDLIKEDLEAIEEESIMIYDNDIFGSSQRVERFVDLVEDLGIEKNFIAYASVEGILENEDLLKRFKGVGLKALLVGYESFSDQEMTYYTKKASVDDNMRAAKLLKSLGIDVWASFMAHPDWTKKDFKSFRRYVRKLSPQISSISPLTPFPNLPLYDEYKDRLMFSPDDFTKWSFGQVMITPKNMSLRVYYFEMMKTNLYINLMMNKTTEMLNRYGLKNILRLSRGSIRAFIKYIGLMIKG